MNIGDLILSLIADGSKLTPGVEKEAQKAGDAGAKTLNQRMAAGLKGGGKVLAAIFSGAAALATAGALQMEDAVARIRSETGASQEQAEQIAKSANRIAGDQQQSLAAVADVSIAIKKNMGATGDQLDQLTEKTVKYARVTKQDGVAAVTAMDDIVDAYGLSLDQVGQVQDQLIVSNQKYGGSIEENQAALAKMAPQLRALNLDYNDGIELLNLFAASGLDAADGQKALNQAITKLPPGETLDQFIKRLSQVQDDGERARLAIEVFGAKSGAKLANAIKPGIDSLDQFGVSAAEAAGAVDKSVDDLDSSLGARFRKVLSQAKAAIRGFGADFGPAVTGIASLASLASALGLRLPIAALKGVGVKIAAAIGAGIVGNAGAGIVADSVADSVEGVAKSSRLSGATEKLGKVLGTGLGTAFAAAFAVVAIAELAKTYADIKAQLDAQAADLNRRVLEFVPKASLEDLKRARQTAQEEFYKLDAIMRGLGPVSVPIFGDARHSLEQTMDALDAQIAALEGAAPKAAAAGQTIGKAASDGYRQGIVAGSSNVTSATVSMVDDATAAAGYAANKKAYEAGRAIPDNTAAGIRSRRQAVMDAFDQLKEDLKNALNPAKEEARIIGVLTSKAMAKGLHSGDPVVRKQAEELRTTALTRLEELVAAGKPLGKDAAQAVADGLRSKNPKVRETARLLAKFLPNALDDQKGNARNKGSNLGRAAASGLKSGFGHPVLTADIHIRGATNDKGRAAGGPVLAGTPYWVNEQTPRTEMFVPTTPGYVLTHADAMRAVMAGSKGVSAAAATNTSTVVNVGSLTLQGVGSDVSPAAAERFGQAVLREVAGGFRQGGARLGVTTSVRP